MGEDITKPCIEFLRFIATDADFIDTIDVDGEPLLNVRAAVGRYIAERPSDANDLIMELLRIASDAGQMPLFCSDRL